MGLLTSLLTLPVSGPIKGAWWVLEQVIEAAEKELYDEDRIILELRALAAESVAGRLSEEEYVAAEAALLERLRMARAFRAASGEDAV